MPEPRRRQVRDEARPGREILVETLLDEGVTHVFGNPGSTELPLIDELSAHSGLRYVHALQENTAVGIADGYALATGRPSFVNLHTLGGLGGGMANLTNAHYSRTPMVVTAGQQRRDHLLIEPVLTGDLTGLAGTVSKWTHEMRSADEVASVTRRAFKDARTPPTGPVFLSIPIDVLDEASTAPIPVRSDLATSGVAARLDEMAERLLAAPPGRLAVVVGDRVARANATSAIEGIAELLGCPVYGAAFSSTNPFPSTHSAWSGYLPLDHAGVRSVLDRFDVVFVVGAKAFLFYDLYDPSEVEPVPPGLSLLHLDDDPAALARNEVTSLGVAGDIELSLEGLLEVLAKRGDAVASIARDTGEPRTSANLARMEDRVRDRAGARPMHPMVAVHACLSGLPPSGIVVDEAVTASGLVKALHKTTAAGEYYFCRGAALGWGMPAAVGVALARPDRPVLCLVGDGAAAYSIQALWSAAHHRVPVVFVVLNNRQYRILKDNLDNRGGTSSTSGRYVAMDLVDPAPDYVSIATGFGVPAARLDDPTSLRDAVASAFAAGEPFLVDAPISGSKAR